VRKRKASSVQTVEPESRPTVCNFSTVSAASNCANPAAPISRPRLAAWPAHNGGEKSPGLSRGAKGEEVVWNLYAGNRSELRQIADAIRVAGERQIRARLTQPLDENEETFPEGRLLTREHKTRELNRQLAERKKKAVLKLNGTLGCEACSVDFFETYGELGREFAECHHLVPLSELREARETRLSELGIVCANAIECCMEPDRGKPLAN
jgi:predicted HNH restriction endonuclease